MLCRKHIASLALLSACTLCLWLCALYAALLLVPMSVRHAALFAIGADAYVTVARCTSNGGRTVPVGVPIYPMMWLLTTAACGPLDVVAFGSGTVIEALYWVAKLHVALMFRALLSIEGYIRLQHAVEAASLSHAIKAPMPMDRQRPMGIIVTDEEHSVAPIQQFLSENAQLVNKLVRRMNLHVYILSPALFHQQWASLRSLYINPDVLPAITVHSDAMEALIRATPNLYELTICNLSTDAQFGAKWTLTDGWGELRKVKIRGCSKALVKCVTLQTRQLTRATFTRLWSYIDSKLPVLREFVRRNCGTLTYFYTDSFGITEVELLTQCHMLQQITLVCRGVDWDTFTWNRFTSLIQSMPSLRVVSVATPGPVPSNIALAPGALRHITTLRISSVQIATLAVHSILQAAPNLCGLSLFTLQDAIDCDMLRAIGNSAPQLRKLRLQNIGTLSDDVLRTLATTLPQLTHIILGCNQDSGDGEQWATVDSVPQHMLKHIKLIWIYVDTPLDRREPEYADTECLRRLDTALTALVTRSHCVFGTTVAMLNEDFIYASNRCAFGGPPRPPGQLTVDAILPDEWPDINDIMPLFL